MNQNAAARREALAGLTLSKQLADRQNATYAQLYHYAWLATSVEPTDLQDAAGAMPYIQRAVAIDKGLDPLSLLVLADAYAGTNDFAHAVATLEKADVLFPAIAQGNHVPRQQQIVRGRLALYRPRLTTVAGR